MRPRRPLAWLVAAFAFGVGVVDALPGSAAVFTLAALCCAIVGLLVLRSNRIPLLMLLAAALVGGIYRDEFGKAAPNDVSALAPRMITLLGRVDSDPVVAIPHRRAPGTARAGVSPAPDTPAVEIPAPAALGGVIPATTPAVVIPAPAAIAGVITAPGTAPGGVSPAPATLGGAFSATAEATPATSALVTRGSVISSTAEATPATSALVTRGSVSRAPVAIGGVSLSPAPPGGHRKSTPRQEDRGIPVRFVLAVTEAQLSQDAEQTFRRVTGNVSVSTRLQHPTAPLPQWGDQVMVRGRLELPSDSDTVGGLSVAERLARRDIFSQIQLRGAASMKVISRPSPLTPIRLVTYFRHRVIETSRRYLRPEEAGLLSGILIGDRQDMPPTVQDQFERTGTSHILATAGLHVGIVLGMLILLLRRPCPNARLRALLLIGAMIFYAAAAGGRVAVTRAALMACVALAAPALDRETDSFTAIATAALLLLLHNPMDISSVGFELSFAIIISLACASPLLFEADRRVRLWAETRFANRPLLVKPLCILVAFALISFTAQLGAAPIVAYRFHELSPSGLPANLLVVPLLAMVLYLGFCAMAFSAVTPVAWVLYGLLSPLLSLILTITARLSDGPLACIAVAEVPLAAALVIYGLLWAALLRASASCPSRFGYTVI